LFRESDFSSSGNTTNIEVVGIGAFTDPVNVTLRPLTVSQYQSSGATGCTLNPNDDPAESKRSVGLSPKPMPSCPELQSGVD